MDRDLEKTFMKILQTSATLFLYKIHEAGYGE